MAMKILEKGRKDYEKSNIEYNEVERYKYKVICKGCKQEFYRKRISRDFMRRYRCAKCGGELEVWMLA